MLVRHRRAAYTLMRVLPSSEGAPMNALLPWVVPVLLCQSDPGTVVVVQGDLGVVTFELAGGTPYRLNYDTLPITAWFNRAQSQFAEPDITYIARSKGDLNADGLLNGLDIQGFVNILVHGPFDPEADFTGDGLLSMADVPDFVEAILAPYPADGVVLYVQAGLASSTLGDAAIDLLTDPDMDEEFTVAQTEPVTVVEFIALPSGGVIGSAGECIMNPAIPPLAFDDNTTAVWEGEILVSGGPGPMMSVTYNAEQVRVRSPDNGALILGDGMPSGPLSEETIVNSINQSVGRITFDFNGIRVTTPEFLYIHAPPQFRVNELEYDPHDPGGFEPNYGQSSTALRVLHVIDPVDPQLDTFWFYHVALEVPVEENPDTIADAPQILFVDIVAHDASGEAIDSFEHVELTRFDDDGDPFFINYRSDLVQPFIFVDAAVDKLEFPDLRILQVDTAGFVTVRPG